MGGLIRAAIDRLSRRYPRMSVRTEQGSAADVVNHLNKRKCEIAILRPPSPEPELAVEPLFYAQLFVVAGSRGKWTRQRRISFANLPEEPLIQSVGEMEPGSAMLEAFRSAGVEAARRRAEQFRQPFVAKRVKPARLKAELVAARSTSLRRRSR